jgi:hypothetical protein
VILVALLDDILVHDRLEVLRVVLALLIECDLRSHNRLVSHPTSDRVPLIDCLMLVTAMSLMCELLLLLLMVLMVLVVALV